MNAPLVKNKGSTRGTELKQEDMSAFCETVHRNLFEESENNDSDNSSAG